MSSPTIFFTSDLHFGHKNIHYKFAPSRKVLGETLEEQHNSLIERWNSRVHKKDTVYVLGDVAWTAWAYQAVVPQLNGIKFLVRGNHDRLAEGLYLTDFNKILGAFPMELFPGCDVVLTHIPIHPQEMQYRWKFNIHGHLHEKVVLCKGPLVTSTSEIPDQRYINVCCEQTDFYPLAIDELRKIAAERLEKLI